MRHHPSFVVVLTLTRTTVGRQFGWGATPSKNIKVAQRSTHVSQKLTEECQEHKLA